LYNLANDLAEQSNLAVQQPQKVAQLKAKLQAWQQQIGADIPTKLNPEYDAKVNQQLIREQLLKPHK